MLFLAPVPGVIVETPVLNNSITGRVTQAMRYWLLSLIDRINAGPQTVSSVSLTTQAASRTTTALPILSVLPGVYRVSMTTQVTQAATTSSQRASAAEARTAEALAERDTARRVAAEIHAELEAIALSKTWRYSKSLRALRARLRRP